MIRTEDGEFHVLSVLESTDPTNINCDVDQRVIEPDGSIDGGFGSLNVLPNLAKKSKPYPAMTEHSSKLENEYLRKQLNTYKVSKQSESKHMSHNMHLPRPTYLLLNVFRNEISGGLI